VYIGKQKRWAFSSGRLNLVDFNFDGSQDNVFNLNLHVELELTYSHCDEQSKWHDINLSLIYDDHKAKENFVVLHLHPSISSKPHFNISKEI
jgi:hypothetical protein